MSRKYFGTDGVRGRVGQTPITPEFAMLLAQAAGRILKQQTTDGEVGVFIGKDTRVSGYMLEAALQAGFLSAGVDVMLGGPLPTPAVAYLTRAQRLSAGVVISASHNPFYDNGIKFFSDKGTKLPDEMELQIEKEMDRGFSCVDSARLGKARRLDDAAGRYVEFCKSTFPSDLDLKGFKIYVDCANGAAYHIAPDVYHELGATVVCGGNTPDGFNINEGVGATHTETLPDRVQKAGCDIGIALDGDADRLIMADRHQVYNGDQLLYLIAKDRLNRGELKGVVGTLMTNFAIEKQFKTLGVPFHRAKVGDRYVLEIMLKEGIDLGGEGSGHLIILDKQTTGDGIVSSLQVLSVLARNRSTLESVLSEVALTPQVLINRRYKAGYVWNEDQALLDAIKAVSKELEGKGRVLVRASGTEPLVRVMVECEDIGEAKKHAQALAELIPLEAKGEMMTTSVLIVEDEPSILELISYTCRTSGMEVRKAANVAEAKKNLEAAKPDIILLDWMLPDCAGLDWLRELRSYHSNESLPVIMLTARGQEDDRVRGLEAGADDYVTKPFSPRELVARIRAVIRRKGGDALPDTLRVGPLEIDAERYEARVNGKPLRLSAVEFKFLQVFAKHPGRVYSRAQLIDKVWGVGADIDERTVDVHMLRLRKQLAGTAAADFIETVRGVGYRASNLKA